MSILNKLEAHIIKQATAGKLPGLFVKHEGGYSENGVPLLEVPCDLKGTRIASKGCAVTIKVGDIASPVEGPENGFPNCLACEAHYIANGLIGDFRNRRPVLTTGFESDWEMVKAGYVKVEALEKELNKEADPDFILDEWMSTFFYIWRTEIAAEMVLPFYAKENDAVSSDEWEEKAKAAKDWIKSRRRDGREFAERALPESRASAPIQRQWDQSNSALFLDLLEMAEVEVPDRARHFLEGFCNTPKYRIKALLHMKKWMEVMAKPGPKVVFRNSTTGEEKEMPYPEESLKQATDNLAQIEQEIERLQALA